MESVIQSPSLHTFNGGSKKRDCQQITKEENMSSFKKEKKEENEGKNKTAFAHDNLQILS